MRHGEILGLAGLVGSGRTELARAVFGIDRRLGGSDPLDGEPVAIAAPRDAIDRGIYLVPEDRKRSGLLLDFPIAREHLAARPRAPTPARPDRRPRQRGRSAEAQRRKLDIRTPDVANDVGALSGGNQQKVVLAKWLSMQPARDHLRRADARHRRRRQERDLRADARAGRRAAWPS